MQGKRGDQAPGEKKEGCSDGSNLLVITFLQELLLYSLTSYLIHLPWCKKYLRLWSWTFYHWTPQISCLSVYKSVKKWELEQISHPFPKRAVVGSGMKTATETLRWSFGIYPLLPPVFSSTVYLWAFFNTHRLNELPPSCHPWPLMKISNPRLSFYSDGQLPLQGGLSCAWDFICGCGHLVELSKLF